MVLYFPLERGAFKLHLLLGRCHCSELGVTALQIKLFGREITRDLPIYSAASNFELLGTKHRLG